MSKDIKKAEKMLTDATDFPRESMREKLARQYGIDAVALSGPCEGQNLVSCIVDQLEKRWDNIKQRFAGDKNKTFKLATKMAESYMQKDDTEKCVKDLQSIGYKGAAASGIASYLKAYAMGPAANMEMEQAMGTVMAEPSAPADPMMDDPMGAEPPVDMPDAGGMPGDMGGDLGGDMPMGGDDMEMVSDSPELPAPGMDAGVAPADDGMGGGMVTIELPQELAEKLHDAISTQMPDAGGMGMEGDMGGMDDGMGEGPGLDIEIMDGGGDEMGGEMDAPPGGDLHGEGGDEPEVVVDEVPGEPSEGGDDHEVHGEEEEASSGAKCKACGHTMASEGQKPAKSKPPMSTGTPTKNKEIEHREAEEETANEHEETEAREADKFAMDMRQGHIRAAGKKRVAAETRKLGPEMQLNSTDQIGPHEGKELGDAKEKSPDEPKPLSEGNVALEGYSANEKKYQDKSTMGHEEAFKAHEVEKSEYTGGEKSIMGKDESFPEGKPQVPAGSAPIGGEQWQGGDLSTKGTVIATITPKGIIVEANGKKYLAPGALKNDEKIVAKLQAGLALIKFDGDGKKFAQAALKLVREAEKSGLVDNVTKIDTGKLEDSTFTNDGEKKPEKGGAMTGKGKGSGDYQNEDVTTTDTSKLEDSTFTNDAEKKPDDDTTKAAAAKSTKVADTREKGEYNKEVTHSGDKEVEKPKALEDGNVHSEGYTAGGDKFSDGKTMGHEEKPNFKTVDKSDVSKGEASTLGKDESMATTGPKIPAGGGKMGNEDWDGGDISTKGTTIAGSDQPQKRSDAELHGKLAEATVREARLKAASLHVADLLSHGDIRPEEFTSELEKIAAMSVPAIQNLIANTKTMRSRLAANAETHRHVTAAAEGTVAGLGMPIVITASKNELSLKDRLVKELKLTKTLDAIDGMEVRR